MISEENDINLDNESTRNSINIHLTNVLKDCVITPYVGLERVKKVLAYFHIHIGKSGTMPDLHGFEVFDADQFGEIMGMNDNGQVVSKKNSEYKIFFEYLMNEKGHFDIFCEIVDQEELDELLDAVEEDMEDEPKELEESNKEERKSLLKTIRAGVQMRASNRGEKVRADRIKEQDPSEIKKIIKSVKKDADSVQNRMQTPQKHTTYYMGLMKKAAASGDLHMALHLARIQTAKEQLKRMTKK